jgi:hypothetical protein
MHDEYRHGEAGDNEKKQGCIDELNRLISQYTKDIF